MHACIGCIAEFHSTAPNARIMNKRTTDILRAPVVHPQFTCINSKVTATKFEHSNPNQDGQATAVGTTVIADYRICIIFMS